MEDRKANIVEGVHLCTVNAYNYNKIQRLETVRNEIYGSLSID